MKPVEPKPLSELVASLDHEQLFALLFSASSLEGAFDEKFSSTTSKGIDRINGFQFAARAKHEFGIVSKKILSGQFRFTPFMEVLRPKGRDKYPRLIGIPTVRDRVVLHQLNRYLATVYPERVPKNVASTYVRHLAMDLPARDAEITWVCSTDIKTFYDSIKRPRLLTVLARRIKCEAAVQLVAHAVATPTVPKNTHRLRRNVFASKDGVPQGLAISNILASIYMQDVDDAMSGLDITYYRYVDDVLMYGVEDVVKRAFESLRRRLALRGLKLHPVGSGKTHIEKVSKRFGYLGYTFEGSLISVRESTIEKFLQSIASRFSDFVHNRSRRLARFSYLTDERLKEIFLSELNERITGAISKNKRYGWIAYFNQINDLTLLHRLDVSIDEMFRRLPEFNGKAPLGLKKLRRAYYEMKFNPRGGYVRDYDRFTTRIEKLKLLTERGRVGPNERLTDAEIDEKFDRYVRHVLAAMHADEGTVYG